MTLLRRGIKRLSALFCAALLLFCAGTYPLRARAAGVGTLAAVAGVTVLGAYLMASGVYPYISEAGQSLSEWTSDNLQPLLDKYNDYLVSVGKSYQITLNGATPTIKGYLTQGVIMIANDAWNKLREFAQWIQSEYALTDNQTGVKLGVVVDGLPTIPFYSSRPTNAQLEDTGLYIGTSYRIQDFSNPALDTVERQWYLGKSDNRAFGACAFRGSDKISLYFYYCLPLTLDEYNNSSVNFPPAVYFSGTGINSETGTVIKNRKTYDGQTYYYGIGSTLPGYYYGRDNAVSVGAYYYVDDVVLPIYDSSADVVSVGLGLAPGNASFAGITADTTTVAPLEALPADTPWGGLAVQGTSNPAGTVEQGVTDREKPVVRPVEVEVGAGTEVDSETGEVTENPVVITPGDVALPASDYQVPGLSGVFPFSLPWDISRVYSALNAEPVRPEWDVTLYVPVLDLHVPMHIGFSEDVAPAVDNFMALARKLILVFLCVLTLFGIRNIIR